MLAQQRLILLPREGVPGPSWLNLLEMLVYIFHGPEVLNQLPGRLVSHPNHTWYIVRLVAHQTLVVGQQSWIDAILLLHRFLIKQLGIRESLPVPAWGDHGHGWRHELQCVVVASDDDCANLLLARLLSQGTDHIVGLVPWDLEHGDVDGLNHLADALHLTAHLLPHGRPVCLVLLKLLVSKGGHRGVEGDGDVVGFLLLERVQQHHGEAVHRVGQLSLRGGEPVQGKGEEGAIGQRMSIDEHQFLGHSGSASGFC